MACELGLAVNLANRCGTRIEQIEDLRWVFAAAGQPALRVLNHVGHFYAAAVNPRDVLAEFEHQTACLHLSDRIGKRPVPIGQGKVNLPGIMADLKQMDYQGWLVVDLGIQSVATLLLQESIAATRRGARRLQIADCRLGTTDVARAGDDGFEGHRRQGPCR